MSAPVRDAYRAGLRDGFLSILRGPRYSRAPIRVRRSVGSFRTDRSARYEDVARIGRDVKRHEDLVRR